MGRRRRRYGVKIEDSKPETKLSAAAVTAAAVILSASVFFALGKYIEFNSPGAFDSGAYVYSAQHLLDGAKLGVDEKGSAGPATLLVNLIGVKLFGFNETGPEIIQGLLQAVAFVMMFLAMRRMYGVLEAAVGVLVASFCLSAPVIMKYGNVKEQYMIAFMLIAGSAFVLYVLGGKKWWLLLSGAAMVNIFYFKPTGVSVIIAAALFIAGRAALHRNRLIRSVIDFVWLFCGAVIGLIPLALFYKWQNNLAALTNTVPCLVMKLFFFIGVATGAIVCVVYYCRRYRLFEKLRQVRLFIWLVGGGLMLVMAAAFIIYFKYKGEFYPASFVRDAVFIKYPLHLLWKIEAGCERLWTFFASGSDYLSDSRGYVSFKEQAEKVFRYYKALILPVSLACGAVVIRLIRFVVRRTEKTEMEQNVHGLVWFLIVWWLLDMLFVWLSPRSYEEYYLPLNASAAMLGGYLLWWYRQRLTNPDSRILWRLVGGAGVFCMVMMAWPVFFGFSKSPDTANVYKDSYGNPTRERGYVQRLEDISSRRKTKALYPWQQVGDYIRQHSGKNDVIYVWGWYPGIYVSAQRLSCVPKAFESNMHVMSPQALSAEVGQILLAFEKQPPKFIVDTKKRHFPWDRPPLELWPARLLEGRREFIPPQQDVIEWYNKEYAEILTERIGEDEAERFRAMAPLRQYVMSNYEIVALPFDEHVLFRLKEDAGPGYEAPQ